MNITYDIYIYECISVHMLHILYSIHRCLSTETYPLSWKTTDKLTISHNLGIFCHDQQHAVFCRALVAPIQISSDPWPIQIDTHFHKGFI